MASDPASSSPEPLKGEVFYLEGVPAIPDVPWGPSTSLGCGVTLAAYVGAAYALVNGARDLETITLVVVGTVALITTTIARVTQAIVAAKLRARGFPAEVSA